MLAPPEGRWERQPPPIRSGNVIMPAARRCCCAETGICLCVELWSLPLRPTCRSFAGESSAFAVGARAFGQQLAYVHAPHLVVSGRVGQVGNS